MSYDCIPAHLRNDILEKVRATYLKEIDQVIQNDQRVARDLAEFEHHQTLNAINRELQQHQRETYASLRQNALGDDDNGHRSMPTRILSSFSVDERIRSRVVWTLMDHEASGTARFSPIMIPIRRMNVVPFPGEGRPMFLTTRSSISRSEQQQPEPTAPRQDQEVEILLAWRDVQEGLRQAPSSGEAEIARSIRLSPMPRPATPPRMGLLGSRERESEEDDLVSRVMRVIQRMRESQQESASSFSAGAAGSGEADREASGSTSPLLVSGTAYDGLHGEEEGSDDDDGQSNTVAQGPIPDIDLTPVVARRESVTLIVYVYWKSLQPHMAPSQSLLAASSSVENLQWNIKGLEYELSRSGGEHEDDFEMSRCQVRRAAAVICAVIYIVLPSDLLILCTHRYTTSPSA